MCLLSFKFSKHDFRFQLGFILISNSNRFIQASVFVCVNVRARGSVCACWYLCGGISVGGYMWVSVRAHMHVCTEARG